MRCKLAIVSLFFCLTFVGIARGQNASGGSANLDTLIAQFDSKDLRCQDAVDAFRTYYQAHSTSALAALYTGRAFDLMGVGLILNTCSDSTRSPVSQLDSALGYYRIAARLDPEIRDRKHNSRPAEFMPATYNFKAFWYLLQRDTLSIIADLKEARKIEGYSDAILAYSRVLFKFLPPNAIFIAAEDNDIFPILYLQFIEGERRDVSIIIYPFLEYVQYEHFLDEGIPNAIQAVHFFQVPGTSDTTKFFPKDEYLELDQAGFSPSPEVFPIDSGVHQEMESALGHPIGYDPSTTAFRANEYGQGVNSTMLARILRANKWRRPIYFSESVSGDLFQNIDPDLRHEGFAARLFPDSGSDYTPYSNEKRIWLDTTHYLEAVDSALALLPRADTFVARMLSALFLNSTYSAYDVRLIGFIPNKHVNEHPDTAAMWRYTSRLRPLARSNPENAISEWAMFAAMLAMTGKSDFKDDAQWIRSCLEPQVRGPGGDTTYGKEQICYGFALWGLHDCEALRNYAAYLKKPTSETEAKIYDAIESIVGECK